MLGSLPDLLKQLPEAAKSPLAFVAYCLVIAAWTLQQWFATKPQRDAKAILSSFKDDKARLGAISQIFNEPPPTGLKGNEAILTWVRTRSAEKTKVLMVVAWLVTLVAVLIFLVAVKNVSPNGAHEISIRFSQNVGTHSPCPLRNARVGILVNSRPLYEQDIVDCTAKVAVQLSTADATLSLINSGTYQLVSPGKRYQLALAEWDVLIKGPLQITLFNYSGQCPDLSQAFDTFETLVRFKTNSLRGMFRPNDDRFDYLSRLSVVTTGDEFRLTNEAAHNYWQETGSLQLLSGMCIQSPSGEVMLSKIFFGDLKGKLPSELLEASLAVSAREFSNTRDLHTASILYALAQEAGTRKLGQDVVIDYLQEAHTIASQIDSSSGKQLRDAIDQSLREANAPQPMELPK